MYAVSIRARARGIPGSCRRPVNGSRRRDAAQSHNGLFHDQGIQIGMDGRSCPRDNSFVARRWRTHKYKEVDLHAYDTVSVACAGIARYFTLYNTRRPHSSLADPTSEEADFASLPLTRAAQPARRSSYPTRFHCREERSHFLPVHLRSEPSGTRHTKSLPHCPCCVRGGSHSEMQLHTRRRNCKADPRARNDNQQNCAETTAFRNSPGAKPTSPNLFKGEQGLKAGFGGKPESRCEGCG